MGKKGSYLGGSSIFRGSPLGVVKTAKGKGPGVRIGGHTKKRKALIAAAKVNAAKPMKGIEKPIAISRKDVILAKFKTFAAYRAAVTKHGILP